MGGGGAEEEEGAAPKPPPPSAEKTAADAPPPSMPPPPSPPPRTFLPAFIPSPSPSLLLHRSRFTSSFSMSHLRPDSFDSIPRLLRPKSLPPSSSFKHSPARFWSLFFLAFLAVFLLLPSLSSTLLSSLPSLVGSFPTPSSHDQARFSNVEDDDFTLGGLLPDQSDTAKCSSRGLIHRYRSKSLHSPSPYLIRKLRQYEALHQRCGPGTEAFRRVASLLQVGKDAEQAINEDECKYIVWIANSGLGNRLISIASAFVYALLTGRVLLLDGKSDMGELLCEPFVGGVSWILPPDFAPVAMQDLNTSSAHRLGLHLQQGTVMPSIRKAPEMDKKRLLTTSAVSTPSSLFIYVHLMHDYDFYDKLFFCEEEQSTLHTIPWLFLKTNLYFVPSMYLYLPRFREELHRLFPDREAIFHHISRYLFFPTNSVWSEITRFYDAYLAAASQIVGIQIRTFAFPPVLEPYLTKQILTCATENGLLPKVLSEKEWSEPPSSYSRNKTAVLVTSLLPDYRERMVTYYGGHPTETGEVVSLHQPSHEVHQNTEAHGHNKKAWSEMCLLSFSDKLITSPMSTFGYIAVGLAGIRPWMLARAKDGVAGSPVCSRVVSMDPCFHAPPYYKCDSNEGGDTSQILPFVKHCEDVSWGLKLFPSPET